MEVYLVSGLKMLPPLGNMHPKFRNVSHLIINIYSRNHLTTYFDVFCCFHIRRPCWFQRQHFLQTALGLWAHLPMGDWHQSRGRGMCGSCGYHLKSSEIIWVWRQGRQVRYQAIAKRSKEYMLSRLAECITWWQVVFFQGIPAKLN